MELLPQKPSDPIVRARSASAVEFTTTRERSNSSPRAIPCTQGGTQHRLIEYASIIPHLNCKHPLSCAHCCENAITIPIKRCMACNYKSYSGDELFGKEQFQSLSYEQAQLFDATYRRDTDEIKRLLDLGINANCRAIFYKKNDEKKSEENAEKNSTPYQNDGATPFIVAVRTGSFDVVDTFLAHPHAIINKDVVTFFGSTATIEATARLRDDVDETHNLEVIKILCALLNHQPPPNLELHYGLTKTAVCRAAETVIGRLFALQSLFAAGASANHGHPLRTFLKRIQAKRATITDPQELAKACADDEKTIALLKSFGATEMEVGTPVGTPLSTPRLNGSHSPAPSPRRAPTPRTSSQPDPVCPVGIVTASGLQDPPPATLPARPAPIQIRLPLEKMIYVSPPASPQRPDCPNDEHDFFTYKKIEPTPSQDDSYCPDCNPDAPVIPVRQCFKCSQATPPQEKFFRLPNEEQKQFLIAAFNGDVEFVRNYLVQGKSPNARGFRMVVDCPGTTPGTTVPYLIMEGETPLMLACRRGKKEVVALLLKEIKTNVNARTAKGSTALIETVRAVAIDRQISEQDLKTFQDILASLIERGADVDNHGNDSWTALRYAFSSAEATAKLAPILLQLGNARTRHFDVDKMISSDPKKMIILAAFSPRREEELKRAEELKSSKGAEQPPTPKTPPTSARALLAARVNGSPRTPKAEPRSRRNSQVGDDLLPDSPTTRRNLLAAERDERKAS